MVPADSEPVSARDVGIGGARSSGATMRDVADRRGAERAVAARERGLAAALAGADLGEHARARWTEIVGRVVDLDRLALDLEISLRATSAA